MEHLKRKQELERKLTDFNYARELMEAEMEAERAYVSFSVLDRENGPEGLREPAQLSKGKENHQLWSK